MPNVYLTWKVASFHVSINAFDNPILRIVGSKAGTWGGVIGAVIGVVAGILIAWLILARRRRVDAAAAG